MTLTPERWQRARDVLHEAMQLEVEERSVFLDSQCASDPSLRVELKELLAAEGEIGSEFLEEPALAALRTDTATSHAVLPSGTQLGPYVVQSFIGAGGMGEVYRARDASLKRDVAIKVLPVSFSSDPDRLRRFQLEAEATAALNHPNILSVFHIGQQDGSPFIVTELLEGETLRQRLRHGALKLRDAIDIAIQTAEGLAAAHEKGIAHRDLKPENLFLAKDGRVKILDFGLAKLTQSTSSDGTTISLRDQTDAGRVLGTVGYMSPEQVRGEPADTRSDIFSLGCVLYEMFTGKRAFRKPTAAETMSAILNDDPAMVSERTRNIPPALERVVRRCLEKVPGRRFQSASDLAFGIKALSETGSGTTQIIKRASSSKKRVLLGLATALLAVAALAFAWWIRPSAVPVVESVTQLTDDGQPKGLGMLVTDGSRIYFNEGIPGNKKIMQVSTAGGETSRIPTRLTDPETEGILPDGSSLLVFDGEGPVNPAWLVPLPSGEPRRLGSVESQEGDFFPDGRVVFTRFPDLFVAEKDGSNVRKLTTGGEVSFCPRVSPDGKYIAIMSWLPKDELSFLAEASADGSGFHEIMRGNQEAQVTCGYWTPDGNYVVTRVGEDTWLVPRKKRIFEAHLGPTRLTSGPLTYSSLCPSRDGKRIFAIGTKRRVELVRYDTKSKQYVPFLSGISAIDPTFSQDGQWVAYISYPDRTLWRSRADGTDRMQLTYPPMKVTYPYISQDGKRIAFGTWQRDLYVINVDGTSERKIASSIVEPEPAWSPDGNSLVFGSTIESKHDSKQPSRQLETIDLQNGTRSVVRSSQGMGDALWMTADMLVAWKEDATKLVALNIQTGKMKELISGMIVDMIASPDLRYVYYTAGGAEPKAMRIRVADDKVEEITSLKGLRLPTSGGSQIGVAPDGSAVFSRDIGTQEIYALTVKWP